MKYPDTKKCLRCGTADYWIMYEGDGYYHCDLDGQALYPPSFNVSLGERRVWSQEPIPESEMRYSVQTRTTHAESFDSLEDAFDTAAMIGHGHVVVDTLTGETVPDPLSEEAE